MIEQNFAVIGTFILYLAMMMGIGYWAFRKTVNSSDYFLGGRQLGPWPTAISAGASDMSGWLLLGLPGYALVAGYGSFWLAGGLLVGSWLNWIICSKRLRTYTIITNDSLTLPDYFARRFEDKSKLLQTISAFFILLFFLFYTSAGLVAGGKLFQTVFDLNYQLAVIIGTVCVVSYTLFGGFLAVSWTDLVQGLLMAAALMLVPILALDGSISDLTASLAAKNPELLDAFTNNDGTPMSVIAIISLLAWGLGYFGQPHILARFQAASSNKSLTTARRISVIWTMLSIIGAIFVGLIGITYVDSHLGGVLEDSETIFMILVNGMFHPVIAGILLAAILAAIMSTADSQLLVSSSALAEDFYKQHINPEASSEKVVLVGRLGVVGLSLIALALAFNPESSVLGLVSYAWAGFGAAFGPVIILSLYWSRMTRYGALAGILVGGVTIVVWKQLTGGWFDVYEIVPGIIFASIAIVVVSLLTKTPSQSILAKHQEMKDKLSVL